MNPIDNKAVTDDYKSFTSKVTFNSSLDGPTADQLAGKIIVHVDASEYSLILTFSDGSKLEVQGAMYGDCALGVDVTLAAVLIDNAQPIVAQIAQAGFAVLAGLMRLEAELQIGTSVVAVDGQGKFFKIARDTGRITVTAVDHHPFAMPGVIVRQLDPDAPTTED
jgi:hypothetical protein